LKYLLIGEKGVRVEEVILKSVGPKTDPCITPAVIVADGDKIPWKRVAWERSDK
jgi:hypothetical protein